MIGFQVSVDRDAHLANLASRAAAQPVWWIIAVGAGETELWRKQVQQVIFTGTAWTEYGWGSERTHARGERFGASMWIYTDAPIDYLDIDDKWNRVAPGAEAGK